MIELHVTQFPPGWTGICPPRNCAAASAGMAMGYATNGAVSLTAAQVRTESGISCVLGADTRSGGLRAVDVQRVAAKHGVTVDYGPGGITNWPSDELYRRLASNHGAIVLGDAHRAPVNPTSGVVYHSAWVHGLRVGTQGRETHWHDPRSTGAQWVTLGGVDNYQLGMEGVRFAGYVELPAPDTSTGGEDDVRPRLEILYFDPDVRGVITTKPETGFIQMNGDIITHHSPESWGAFGKAWMTFPSPVEGHVYLIRTAPDSRPQWVLVRDCVASIG